MDEMGAPWGLAKDAQAASGPQHIKAALKARYKKLLPLYKAGRIGEDGDVFAREWTAAGRELLGVHVVFLSEQDLEKLIEAPPIDAPVLIEEVDALHAKSRIPGQRLVRRVALDAQGVVSSRAQVLREPRRDQGLADATFGLNDAVKLTHGVLLWAEPKGEDGRLIRAPAWEDFGGGSA